MTKAERLAAKIQRDKETLEKQRQVLADSEATLRAEIRHSEAACGTRSGKPRTNGGTRSGHWPMRPGCFGMEQYGTCSRCLPALGGTAGRGTDQGRCLEALVGYPERSYRRGLRMGRGRDAGLVSVLRTDLDSGAIGVSLRETQKQEASTYARVDEATVAHLHFKRTVYRSGGGKASQRLEYITRQPERELTAADRQLRYVREGPGRPRV